MEIVVGIRGGIRWCIRRKSEPINSEVGCVVQCSCVVVSGEKGLHILSETSGPFIDVQSCIPSTWSSKVGFQRNNSSVTYLKDYLVVVFYEHFHSHYLRTLPVNGTVLFLNTCILVVGIICPENRENNKKSPTGPGSEPCHLAARLPAGPGKTKRDSLRKMKKKNAIPKSKGNAWCFTETAD